MSSLGSMTFGSERFDEARASTDLQYLSTWVERSRKAFTTLALSLSVQLRRTLDVERFEPCMDAPSQLWDEIRAHFEQGNGVNPTYLKAQMYNRRLQASENVDTFVQDMERRRRLLLDNGGSMEDWELADLLLSSSLPVFPQLAMDHTLWLGEHHPRDLSLPSAVQRLGTAEQSHQQLRQQGSNSADNGAHGLSARQVHGVAAQNQGLRRSNKKRKSNQKQQAQPRKSVKQLKADTVCVNCKAKGHWYGDPQCPVPMTPEQTAARAKRESIEKKRRTEKNVRSFAGTALVSDRATVERADEDEDKMTVPPAAESTPTIGPLPVGWAFVYK
ncbi:gag-polypeptide of LTR copia-type [Phytophthora infestans]|uniref:Gag-polypeptide of LTR copia-type n=1 Tax=Phytophthora infestans TaxID=4787 RepID=A0A8S9VCK8_PHYIN|nr:gag-polypeptide of LTR copia-type [Phytophthora infestans]KAF4148308.1 gag-polypeptide of LTR copia-type [Phytophthora infestans]